MRYYSMARFRIRDYRTFKAEFDGMKDHFREIGFKTTWLNRNADDTNDIVILHEVDDMDKVRNFYRSDQFHDCLKKAGVLDEAQVTYLEELEMVPETVHTA